MVAQQLGRIKEVVNRNVAREIVIGDVCLFEIDTFLQNIEQIGPARGVLVVLWRAHLLHKVVRALLGDG